MRQWFHSKGGAVFVSTYPSNLSNVEWRCGVQHRQTQAIFSSLMFTVARDKMAHREDWDVMLSWSWQDPFWADTTTRTLTKQIHLLPSWLDFYKRRHTITFCSRQTSPNNYAADSQAGSWQQGEVRSCQNHCSPLALSTIRSAENCYWEVFFVHLWIVYSLWIILISKKIYVSAFSLLACAWCKTHTET